MHKIILPIDTKSLYYNILNDNLKGHTCTVATPIKQGKTLNRYLKEVYKIPKQIDFELHDSLLRDLIKNSKSVVKINNVFVFNKLKVNGEIINVDASYCFYVKEEIDEKKAQFGRTKLHYPISLKYEPMNIDNRRILNAISDKLNGYAFIVESFEYNFNDDSLDFNVLLVGYSNIPYSKVFINQKGIGGKYNQKIKNYFDLYDFEIVSMRKKLNVVINTDNFVEYIENSRIKAKKISVKYLEKLGATDIRDISKDYPYSLFDLQYYLKGKIKYCIVFSTYTNKLYFDLSVNQNHFIKVFNNASIIVVTDIENEAKINHIKINEIDSFSVLINGVRFIR